MELVTFKESALFTTNPTLS